MEKKIIWNLCMHKTPVLAILPEVLVTDFWLTD